jgi:hypothetical protein
MWGVTRTRVEDFWAPRGHFAGAKFPHSGGFLSHNTCRSCHLAGFGPFHLGTLRSITVGHQ